MTPARLELSGVSDEEGEEAVPEEVGADLRLLEVKERWADRCTNKSEVTKGEERLLEGGADLGSPEVEERWAD